MITSPSVPASLTRELKAIPAQSLLYTFDTHRPNSAILLEKDWTPEYDMVLNEYPTVHYYSDKNLNTLFHTKINVADLYGIDTNLDSYKRKDVRYKSEILFLGDRTEQNYYILGLSEKFSLKCFGNGWPGTVSCGTIPNEQVPYLMYNADAIIDLREPNLEMTYAMVYLCGRVFTSYKNKYTYEYNEIFHYGSTPRKTLKEKTYQEIARNFQ